MSAEREYVYESCALSYALRTVLRTRPERGDVLAGALAYELAAIIARHAPSQDAAADVVWQFAAVMMEQIRRIGVGVEHP